MKLMPRYVELENKLMDSGSYRKRPWGGLDFYKTLITLSTNHKFLYRKNFIDQVKSLACANNSKIFNYNREYVDVVLSDVEILNARKLLFEEYYMMKDLYDLFPGEIIAYEDFSTPDKKYPDYKNIEGNFDIIENFDIFKEIFGK
jgi:hypothetical protein